MMKETFDAYQMRCDKFLDRIFDDRFDDTRTMSAEFAKFQGLMNFEKHLEMEYTPLHEGEIWGHDWESAFVHVTCDIPAEWQGKELAISLIFSGETLLFDQDGVPFYALTGNCVFQSVYFKDFLLVDERIIKDGRIDVWCETAANGFGGKVPKRDPHFKDKNRTTHCEARLVCMKLGLFNREAWELYRDYEVLHNLYKSFAPKNYRAKKILTCLNDAISIYGYNSQNAAKAREVLKRELSRPAMDSALTASAIGHAHIDVGWYWPISESSRKAGRTFASQIELLRKYPDYIFGASQAQLYAYVKDQYPELYKKIKQAVADSRWEVQGGMWVEADCNIISGESMVRQFVHGKNFFMDEFGVDVKNLWLPDVFGYSANLPQIIKKSGCDYFLTQKLSWNHFNKLPNHTFIWCGIDGSSVLTHFPPENDYNAPMMPKQLIAAQDRFAEGDFMDEFASLFGIGDGGGGPSDLYLERATRLQNLEGVPKVKYSKTSDFFNRIEKYRDKLRKWYGELYLELHRGTLTTQSRSKRFNRKLEQLLTAAEYIACCADMKNYPTAEFDKIWKMLLTNQFHDILPGSAIREVYEVIENEYLQAIDILEKIIDTKIAEISCEDNNSILLINTLDCEVNEILELPADWINYSIYDEEDNLIPTQIENGKLTIMLKLQPLSFTHLKKGEKNAAYEIIKSDEKVLENDLIRYIFDEKGLLISAYDKVAKREVMPSDSVGNDLCLYIDRPNYWDAWDVELFYREEAQTRPYEVKISKVQKGELYSLMEIEFKISASTISQKVLLKNNSKRLDFINKVNWQEEHQMLRVSFGADIQSTEASYDIQYGFIKRPVHENTSWDLAKFEVSAHKYFDISEAEYGVALLNDCKYGCRAWEKKLDLALLRSTLYPDHLADQGEHEFTYCYLPHTGNLEHSVVMQEATSLNRLPLICNNVKANIVTPIVVNSENISLEVIKKAEKSDKKVIRLVEKYGKAGTAKLKFNYDVQKITETNLIEWTQESVLTTTNNEISIDFKPFEIKTFVID